MMKIEIIQIEIEPDWKKEKRKIEKDETNRNRNELIAGEGVSKHSIRELLRRVTVVAPVRSESGGKWNERNVCWIEDTWNVMPLLIDKCFFEGILS
ncbi:hypothetical protein QL285_010081 [Trifolium repens]|nr:hypothetical protein QL285_010081 [Trifolium repens]